MSTPAPAGGGRGDDLAGTSDRSLPAAPDFAYGTVAELESWLRSLVAGRPWYPHRECTMCRAGLELAS